MGCREKGIILAVRKARELGARNLFSAAPGETSGSGVRLS